MKITIDVKEIRLMRHEIYPIESILIINKRDIIQRYTFGSDGRRSSHTSVCTIKKGEEETKVLLLKGNIDIFVSFHALQSVISFKGNEPKLLNKTRPFRRDLLIVFPLNGVLFVEEREICGSFIPSL